MKRFDFTILLGLVIGLAAIVFGAYLENLNPGFLWHPTALLIVGGGTFGAVVVKRGLSGVQTAIKAFWQLRHHESEDLHKAELARLTWLTQSARKKGVRVYEAYAETCSDSLVAQGLLLVAEQADPDLTKDILLRRLDWEDERGLHDAQTFEAAGAFAPTFGILGAVIGLISVLRVIDQPEALGSGIATAFVATIYGIGVANLFFFPVASRLRARHESRIKRREEIVAVILAMAANEGPRAIANRFNLKISVN